MKAFGAGNEAPIPPWNYLNLRICLFVFLLISCLPLRVGSATSPSFLSAYPTTFPLVKTGVGGSTSTFNPNWPVFRFIGFYISLQTAQLVEWKLWVSLAKLGGQRLAAPFRPGTSLGETGRKREGWFPKMFLADRRPNSPSCFTDDFFFLCQVCYFAAEWWIRYSLCNLGNFWLFFPIHERTGHFIGNAHGKGLYKPYVSHIQIVPIRFLSNIVTTLPRFDWIVLYRSVCASHDALHNSCENTLTEKSLQCCS